MCYIHCIINENSLFGCFGIFWMGAGGNFQPLSACDCCLASWMFLSNPGHHSRIFQPQASLVFTVFVTGRYKTQVKGHRSKVIVLPIQKVSQTLVKANLRPKRFSVLQVFGILSVLVK